MPEIYAGIPELDAEARAISRRQKIAETLAAQSALPMQGHTAGKYYIPPSPLSGLAQLLNAHTAKTQLDKADEDMRGLETRRQQGVTDALLNYQRTGSDRNVSVPNVGAMTGSMDEQDAPRQDEVVKGDKRKAITDLLANAYAPAPVKQMAMQDYTHQQTLAENAANNAALMKAIAQPVAAPQLTQEQTTFAGSLTPEERQAYINTVTANAQGKQAQFSASSPNVNQLAEPQVNPAMVAAMPGQNAAKIAAILQAQQAQQATLSDRKEGREQTEQLRRDLAGQSEQSRIDAAALASQNKIDAAALADQNRIDAARLVAEAKAQEGKPKLKPGERFTESGSVEAIPGSSEYVKQSGLHSKDNQTKLTVNAKADNAISKIDEILDKKNAGAFESNFGGYNALATQFLPGNTQNIRAKIDSLKSDMKSAGLDVIRAGGGVGQMTEREWPIVERMIANISPLLSEKEARDELEKVKAYIDKLRIITNSAYDTEWSKTQFYKGDAPSPGATPPKVGGVMKFDKNGNPIQ
jgi:hypothetical protein